MGSWSLKSTEIFFLYRLGSSHCINVVLVVLLDFQSFIKLRSDLAYDLIVDILYTLLLPSASRLDNRLLEVAFIGSQGTVCTSSSVDIHRELILLTTKRIRRKTLSLVMQLLCLLNTTTLSDLLNVSSAHHWRFRRNLAW